MTLQEAIEIIGHQKKYITGNPKLLEAYDYILKWIEDRKNGKRG